VSDEPIYTYLPIPVDEKTPAGYRLIVAYEKGGTVVIPINLNFPEGLHNCDWEGCSSINHVVRFSISNKYETEETLTKQQAEIERLKCEIDKRDKLFIGYCNEIQSLKEELEAEKQKLKLKDVVEFIKSECGNFADCSPGRCNALSTCNKISGIGRYRVEQIIEAANRDMGNYRKGKPC
jgi:hypothetical protein